MKQLLLSTACCLALVSCGDLFGGGNGNSGGQETGNGATKGDPANAEMALTAMSLNESGAGHIDFATKEVKGASATYSDVKIVGPDGEGIGAERLVINGLNMVDDAPSFTELTFENISPLGVPEDTEVEMSVASLSLKNPNATTAAFVASLIDGEGEPTPPEFSEVSFSDFSLNGFAMKVNEDDVEFEMGIAELSAADLIEGRVGAGLVEGMTLTFDVPQSVSDAPFPIKGNFNLDKMQLDGLNLSGLNEISDLGDDPEEMAAALQKAFIFDSPIDPGYDAAEIKGFNFDLSGLSLVLDDATMMTKRNKEGVATKVVSDPTTMFLKLDPSEGQLGAMAAGGMAMFGYADGLEIFSESAASYDPKSDLTTYDKYHISVKDALALDFKGSMGKFGAVMSAVATMEEDEEAVLEALQALEIHSMTLKISDDSLTDKALNFAAMMQGEDADDLKSQMQMMLAMGAAGAGGLGIDPEIPQAFISALSSFIEKPGDITIKLNPDSPIVFGEIEDPSTLTKDAMGLSVTYSE